MRYISMTVLLLLLLAVATPAWAAEGTDVSEAPTVTSETVVAPPSEKEPVIATKNIATLQATGRLQIRMRLGALTKLSNKLTSIKGITSEQRKMLKQDIAANTTGLTALSSKIVREKNLETLKGFVRSIYTDFRVYSIVIPRIEGQVALFRQMSSAKVLGAHWTRLDATLNTWQSKGVDVVVNKTLLANVKTDLDAASAAYQKALVGIQAVKPSDYPAKATFETLRAQLKEGNTRLKAARVSQQKVAVAMQKQSRTMKIEERTKKTNTQSKAASPKPVTTSAPVVAPSPASASQLAIVPVITMIDQGFMPNTLTVKAGARVMFRNEAENAGMWVASDNHPTHRLLAGFDEMEMTRKGGEYSFTFTKPGRWTFHNHVSPNMTGVVIVE